MLHLMFYVTTGAHMPSEVENVCCREIPQVTLQLLSGLSHCIHVNIKKHVINQLLSKITKTQHHQVTLLPAFC